MVLTLLTQSIMSLSARRAWIEMDRWLAGLKGTLVALRKESVDRNVGSALQSRDRFGVALRKESVDRNSYFYIIKITGIASLSARRAWIEMSDPPSKVVTASDVALRKESVDRNKMPVPAWIYSNVALRKESVDRNLSYLPMAQVR